MQQRGSHEEYIPSPGATARDSVHHRKRNLPATNLSLPSWNESNRDLSSSPTTSPRIKISGNLRFMRHIRLRHNTFTSIRSAFSLAAVVGSIMMVVSVLPLFSQDFNDSYTDMRLLVFNYHGNNYMPGSLSIAQPKSLDRSRESSPHFFGIHYVPALSGRYINPHDDARYHRERVSMLEDMDEEIEVASDHERVILEDPTRYEPYDELYQTFAKRSCQRPKWSFDTHMNCNIFHQVALDRPFPQHVTQEHAVKYLSEGSFRLAWLLQELGQRDEETVVMKNLRLALDWNALTMKQVHLEALVMSQTLDSQATADIFGHCGTSILVETGQSIRNSVFYSQSLETEEDIARKRRKYNSLSLNDLTDEQRLKMALQMAESLAALHGNPNGVIVNDDLQVFQWVVCKDGNIKLNDFNNAIIMEWDTVKNEYCKFVGEFDSVYRSPQENTGEPTDESADVHVLGSMYYNILTGLMPFYQKEKDRYAVRAMVKLKEKPIIDPGFRNGTLIQRTLVSIMEACWSYESEDRPSVFTVLNQLRDTVQQYEKTHPGVKIEAINLKPLGRPL